MQSERSLISLKERTAPNSVGRVWCGPFLVGAVVIGVIVSLQQLIDYKTSMITAEDPFRGLLFY